MASARKNFSRSKQIHGYQPRNEQFEKACFLADLLDGTIKATAVYEVRNAQQRLLRLEYDDPNG